MKAYNSEGIRDFISHPDLSPRSQLKPKVLIVEDDITQEPIWDYIIDKAAHNAIITWATSVNEASELIHLAHMTRNNFDLVISDIFLSGSLTGLDLWQRFCEIKHGRFLLISGIDPQKLHTYLKGLSVPNYLQKPLNIHETIDTIYRLIHSSLPIDEKTP